jgi:hypothetical protein
LRPAKWLELPEKVVAFSWAKIGLDLERKINGVIMAVKGGRGRLEPVP